jgi:hypothetical protein
MGSQADRWFVASTTGPAGALGGVGVEPDLQLGLRPDDGADVAALDDGVALLEEAALRLAHRLAHVRVAGDLRDARVDHRCAQARILGHARRETAETRERARVVEIRARIERRERDGAVHRAGIEVAVAEAARDLARHRGLARPGRAVDRDHHSGWRVGDHHPEPGCERWRPLQRSGR